MESLKPDHVIAVFDAGGDQERLALYLPHKQSHLEESKSFAPQRDAIREFSGCLGITCLEEPWADVLDVLYTLSFCVPQNTELMVVSHDKKLAQCVNNRTRLAVPDGDAFAILDERSVYTTYGVLPEQFGLLLAIEGDSKNNIAPVEFRSPLPAAELVNKYRDLDLLTKAAVRLEDLIRNVEIFCAKGVASVRFPFCSNEPDRQALAAFCLDYLPFSDAERLIDLFGLQPSVAADACAAVEAPVFEDVTFSAAKEEHSQLLLL